MFLSKLFIIATIAASGSVLYAKDDKKKDDKKIDWKICKAVLDEFCSDRTDDKGKHECIEENEKKIKQSKIKDSEKCLAHNVSEQVKKAVGGSHDHKH